MEVEVAVAHVVALRRAVALLPLARHVLAAVVLGARLLVVQDLVRRADLHELLLGLGLLLLRLRSHLSRARALQGVRLD